MFSHFSVCSNNKNGFSHRKLASWGFLAVFSLGLMSQYSLPLADAAPSGKISSHSTSRVVQIAQGENKSSTSSASHSPEQHPFFHALARLFSFHSSSRPVSSGANVKAAAISHNSTTVTNLKVPSLNIFSAASSSLHLVLHTIAHYIGLVVGPYTYKPSPELLAKSQGKTPVIVLHGTWANGNWMSDIVHSLDNAGIPAYAPTLGTGGKSLSGLLPFLGMVRPAADTEKQLAAYIAEVEKETGASKVDLIGHSQGGLLIKDYIAHDTKDDVQAVVDLGGTQHGTTLDGFADTLYKYSKPVQNGIIKALSAVFGQGIFDQLTKSDFVQDLNQYPDTKPGINYLALASKDDLTSTPYWHTYLKAGPGEDVTTNMEVHAIPGVVGNISHSQIPITPGVVDTITKFIEDHGEPAHITGQIVNPLYTSTHVNTPPTVSLLN